MMLRMSKLLLVLGVALFYAFVVLNNTTDYNSNYQLIRHVLMMDSTLPDNRGMCFANASIALDPVNNFHGYFYAAGPISECIACPKRRRMLYGLLRLTKTNANLEPTSYWPKSTKCSTSRM